MIHTKNIKRFFYLLVLLSLYTFISSAQNIHAADNDNGTYTNPLIPADFPEPDVICAGDIYYMVFTTMFVFSGLYNKTVNRLGNKLNMKFSQKILTGNKFCLFNYPAQQTGEYVDFDWFRVN